MAGHSSSKIAGLTVLLVLLAVLHAPGAFGQAKKPGGDAALTMSVLNQPPDPKDLPLPGQPVEVVFQLLDAWDVIKGVRILAVVDGRLMEIPIKNSYLNKHDQPEYIVQIPAPLSQLSYQILVPDGNGDYSWSRRFFVRRSCLPVTDLIDLDADWRVNGQGLVRACSERASALERELFAFERSLDLVRELRLEMGVDNR